MALTRLPNELIESIITHVLPKGFESLAVTCRRIYALCVPSIKRHDALRSRFHHFTYHENPRDPSPTIATAGDLIKRIAIEPVVARYVRYADFKLDSPRSHIILCGFVRDADCLHDVIRLFAESPYLEQAGLEEELNVNVYRNPRYSQHAAAFLLTLLPNVDRLILPQFWKPLDATDRLIDAVVRKAKQSHSLFDRPSLAQVTRFEPYVSLVPQDRFDLGWARPFLALPRLRSFQGAQLRNYGRQLYEHRTQRTELRLRRDHGIGFLRGLLSGRRGYRPLSQEHQTPHDAQIFTLDKV